MTHRWVHHSLSARDLTDGEPITHNQAEERISGRPLSVTNDWMARRDRADCGDLRLWRP